MRTQISKVGVYLKQNLAFIHDRLLIEYMGKRSSLYDIHTLLLIQAEGQLFGEYVSKCREKFSGLFPITTLKQASC